jgi:flagellar hook-basal body complex protein FliE
MATQSQSTQSTQSTRTTPATPETESGIGEYARRASDTAVSAVDLQFGVALTAADRVRELVKPWRQRETAQRELKSLRHQLTREVNKVERRGGTARRRATQRAKRTRNRVERQVTQRRRRAEQQLKTARTQVSDRVTALV